jgi:hypothetical protein
VICSFSAGIYEDWRDDTTNFLGNDLGYLVNSDPKLKYINIALPNVNLDDAMNARMERALGLGCDGVEVRDIDNYL